MTTMSLMSSVPADAEAAPVGHPRHLQRNPLPAARQEHLPARPVLRQPAGRLLRRDPVQRVSLQRPARLVTTRHRTG